MSIRTHNWSPWDAAVQLIEGIQVEPNARELTAVIEALHKLVDTMDRPGTIGYGSVSALLDQAACKVEECREYTAEELAVFAAEDKADWDLIERRAP